MGRFGWAIKGSDGLFLGHRERFVIECENCLNIVNEIYVEPTVLRISNGDPVSTNENGF